MVDFMSIWMHEILVEMGSSEIGINDWFVKWKGSSARCNEINITSVPKLERMINLGEPLLMIANLTYRFNFDNGRPRIIKKSGLVNGKTVGFIPNTNTTYHDFFTEWLSCIIIKRPRKLIYDNKLGDDMRNEMEYLLTKNNVSLDRNVFLHYS